MKPTYYTKGYLVPDLRHLLKTWRDQGIREAFRFAIIDAIDGHSDGDVVRPRLDSAHKVSMFEFAADVVLSRAGSNVEES